MLTTKLIAVNGDIQVWEFSMDAGTATSDKQLYNVPQGSVIVCEDTELVVGDQTYLQPYGLFFIHSVPEGKTPPSKPYLYSSGAHEVGVDSATGPGLVVYKTLSGPASAKLIAIGNDNQEVFGTVSLAAGTRVAVNASDLTGTGSDEKIKANAVFIVDQSTGTEQGPYIFTDSEIPVGVLTEEIRMPQSA